MPVVSYVLVDRYYCEFHIFGTLPWEKDRKEELILWTSNSFMVILLMVSGPAALPNCRDRE